MGEQVSQGERERIFVVARQAKNTTHGGCVTLMVLADE